MDGKTKLERMMDSIDNNVDAIFDKCCDDLERSKLGLCRNTFKFDWAGEQLYILGRSSSDSFITSWKLEPERVHEAMVQYYKDKFLKFFRG